MRTECPKCEACDGLRHHWMANPQPDDSLPEYACAHCNVRGYQCSDCDGHGCLECGCEGVVEEPT